MAEAAAEDSDYRSQLLDLEAERPGLVADALSRLYAIEEQKYGRYEAEQKRKQDERELALRERAQRAYEQQAGIKNSQSRAKAARDARTLKLKESKQAADLKAAEAKGHQIDASASKAIGYIVDKQGRPVLDSKGNKIPVVQSNKGKGTSQRETIQKATKEAVQLHGRPVETEGRLRGEGRYVARPDAKGAKPSVAGRPRTTNDPNRAQWDGTFSFAKAQEYLMTTYGLNRAQARRILIAAGWRPGG